MTIIPTPTCLNTKCSDISTEIGSYTTYYSWILHSGIGWHKTSGDHVIILITIYHQSNILQSVPVIFLSKTIYIHFFMNFKTLDNVSESNRFDVNNAICSICLYLNLVNQPERKWLIRDSCRAHNPQNCSEFGFGTANLYLNDIYPCFHYWNTRLINCGTLRNVPDAFFFTVKYTAFGEP